MSQSPSEQFCPECGFGVVSETEHGITARLPGHGIKVRMSRGYPFDAPCETCKRRLDASVFELGRRAGQRAERAAFAFLMKTEF